MTATQDFAELATAVFGDVVDAEGLWAEVSKMNPGPSDVHAPGLLVRRRRRRVAKRRQLTPEERQQRLEQNVARASNAVGLTAGAAAIGATARDPRLKEGGKVGRAIHSAGQKVPSPVGDRMDKFKPSTRAKLAGGAFALQAGNVIGDVVTARVLGRKDKKAPVDKAWKDLVGGFKLLSRKQSQVAGAPPPATPKTYGNGVKATPQQAVRWNRKAAEGTLKRQQSGVAGQATRSINQAQQAPAVVQRAGGDVTGALATARQAQARRAAKATAQPPRADRFAAAGGRARGDFNAFMGTTTGKVTAGTGGALALSSAVRRNRDQGSTYDPYAFGKAYRNEYEAKVGFSKFDDDKRLAFGWASIVKKNGQPVVDRQGDYIAIDDLEDAAYVYVQKSRIGGHMHKRATAKFAGEDTPHHVADMVESMVFTPEKIKALGLPDDFPVGWWTGYKVFDDDVWDAAKQGRLTGFSIHGKGIRKSVDESELA